MVRRKQKPSPYRRNEKESHQARLPSASFPCLLPRSPSPPAAAAPPAAPSTPLPPPRARCFPHTQCCLPHPPFSSQSSSRTPQVTAGQLSILATAERAASHGGYLLHQYKEVLRTPASRPPHLPPFVFLLISPPVPSSSPPAGARRPALPFGLGEARAAPWIGFAQHSRRPTSTPLPPAGSKLS